MKNGINILLLFVLAGILSCSETVSSDDSKSRDKNKIRENGSGKDAGSLQPSEFKIFPVDESASDPTLVEFIAKLKEAVKNKDTTTLFESLDSGVIVSYGGGVYGIRSFAQDWNLDQPAGSELWPFLDKILAMGGTWETDDAGSGVEFCIPYAQSDKAFAKYNYDFDWFATAVCIFPDAEVFKAADPGAEVIAHLSFDIVEMDGYETGKAYTKVHTVDKKKVGYVKNDDLLFSASPKLIIKKISNYWKIIAFAPFD